MSFRGHAVRVADETIKNATQMCSPFCCALNRCLLWNNNYISSYKSRGLGAQRLLWVVSALTLGYYTV